MTGNETILVGFILIFWFAIALFVLKHIPEIEDNVSPTEAFVVSALWPLFTMLAIIKIIYRLIKR